MVQQGSSLTSKLDFAKRAFHRTPRRANSELSTGVHNAERVTLILCLCHSDFMAWFVF